MATFNSQGVNISYQVEGQGTPIMLIHGFASSAEGNWRDSGWIDYLLTQGKQVISLDCRGHGKSDKPHDSSAYDGEIMSEDVIRLMDHLDLKVVELMGYSMGARISIDLLKNNTHRFSRAILGGMGETIFNDRSARNDDISNAMTNKDESAVENPVAKGFRDFAKSTGADLKALAAVMAAKKAKLSPADLTHLKLPVLIVVGDKDDLVGDPQPLADSIPGSEVVILKDRDHLTAVTDQRYKESVLAFLG